MYKSVALNTSTMLHNHHHYPFQELFIVKNENCRSWPGSLVGWSAVRNAEVVGYGFDPSLVRAPKETTGECLNGWNSESVFLSLSLSLLPAKIKFKKKMETGLVK